MLGFGDVSYRRLKASDIPAARAHLERLDDDDCFHHFHQSMSQIDFDDWEARATDHELIGAWRSGRLVGLAELVPGAVEAELTLSVDVELRGRGIGTELFERAATLAEKLGHERVAILVTRGDRQMIDMAVRHEGYSVMRRAQSRLMPGVPHSLLRWLVFELSEMPDRTWFSGAVRELKRMVGVESGHTTRHMSSHD